MGWRWVGRPARRREEGQEGAASTGSWCSTRERVGSFGGGDEEFRDTRGTPKPLRLVSPGVDGTS